MTNLRNRLHVWVSAWLIFQVATLSALVPRDCCAAHRDAHKAHHATAKPAQPDHQMDHGPMTHEMRHGGGHEAAPAAPISPCMMRGTCQGPMAAVVALLSQQGVPPSAAFTITPDVRSALVTRATREHLTRRLASPDSPPPRA